jgi:glyoxylase-like metal-dependent hydrolase (beta-lactamase superfamily II)
MPTSYEIDGLTVIALDDAEGPFFEPRESAFPTATAQQWAQADRQDPGTVRDGGWWLRFRCFALRWPSGRVVLVDTGIGSASAPAKSWAPVPGRLPAELDAAGIAAADVDTVVLTHVHTDHIGWSVDDAGEVAFPNARYRLQRAEIQMVDEHSPGIAQWLLAPLRGSGQLSPVDGDETLADGVHIIATPGHTPGHQSVLLDGPPSASGLLITGDLLVHVLQLIDPSLPYSNEQDPEQARISRTALLARAGRTVLATPHLGDPFVPHPQAHR